MAEKKEVLLKSLRMLLEYPKLVSHKGGYIHYDDYQRLHRTYIRAYKQLYEDVAAFSILPERFIHQAEPIIEKYLEDYKLTEASDQKQWLRVITDFISRFYEFMDEATEMFTEHQSLADETYAFLQRVSLLEAKYNEDKSRESEQEFVKLIPELHHLATCLKVVREAVDNTSARLQNLEPVWQDIKGKINR